DLQVTRPSGNGQHHMDQTAYVQFNFTYRDLDGDRPTCTTVRVSGTSVVGEIEAHWGYPLEGITHFGHIDVPVGNSTIIIEVSDGRVNSSISHVMSINFAINIDGLDRGRRADGHLRFTVSTVGLWEGTDIYGVSIQFVEPGTDPNDPDEWRVGGLFHSATREGDGWSYLVNQDSGNYDIWIIAMDDRAIYAFYLEENVIIEEPDDRGDLDWYLWAFIAIIILAVLTIGIFIIRGRPKA
ncbi:MAG: hypothetical protein KAQ96_10815, partial [Thermoplasmata archaeon]|nr:hypothetical protein [Thermoplasmata archaeon]